MPQPPASETDDANQAPSPDAPSVPPAPHVAPPGRRARRVRTPGPSMSPLWWFALPVTVVLLAAIVWVGASSVPYLAFSPGSATPVEPLVEVRSEPGGPKVAPQPADGDLLYVTVSVRQPTAFEALVGVLDDKVQVVPSKPYLGNQSNDDNTRLNRALMTDSQDKARKVALERLGYDVRSIPEGAFIEDIDPSFPAAKVMKPGATVVGADGKRVRNRDDLVAAISAHEPGDVIRLRIIPLGDQDEREEREVREVEAELGVRPGTKDVAALGVSLVDEVRYEFPLDIRINTGEVGGPSAGLAFTLAILDRLTPGDLLGEKRVAVTGTIELDGSVGPVGGVNHKTEAAISEGAKLFIVPPDEFEQAKETARGRLAVRQASSLDQALRILRRFGGDPLPAKTQD